MTSPNPFIGIVLVGSQRVVLESLDSLLASESDLKVLGTSGYDGAAPLPGKADVALFDLDDAGDDVLEQLQTTGKLFRTIALSISTSAAIALDVFQAGAVGMVSKREPPERLLTAIRKVNSGEAWLGRTMTAEVLHLARLARQTIGKSGTPALSARDRRLIALVSQGWRNVDIARHLLTSEATVRASLTSIFQKLGVPNRFALMIYGSQHGYTNAGDRPPRPMAVR